MPGQEAINPFHKPAKVNNEPPKGREPLLDSRTENLVREAEKANEELLKKRLAESQNNIQRIERPVQQNSIPSEKLKRIEQILAAGGMDSAAQSRSMTEIKEVLGPNF